MLTDMTGTFTSVCYCVNEQPCSDLLLLSSPTLSLTQQSHSQSHTAVPLSVSLSSPTLSLTQQSHSQSYSAVPLSLSNPTLSLTQQSHSQSHSAVPLSVSLSSPTLTQQSRVHECDFSSDNNTAGQQTLTNYRTQGKNEMSH